jgi:hypothetical protein
LVIAALLVGGYYLYNRMHEGGAGGGPPTVTLENQTSYGLTVTMRSGPTLEHFVIGPGKLEKRQMKAGTYSVEGSISDPKTTGFTGTWTLEDGQNYSGGFRRSGAGGGEQLLLIRAVAQ